MTKTIEEYLDALKQELRGSDNATIQDALADANEHLTTALELLRESQPDLDEADALQQIIEQYGTPAETAAAYVEVERRTFPGLVAATAKKPGSPLGRFFGIYADPRAWGALFYMLIAFVTGVVYFSWAVTGLSVSISFALFIFGLPVALLFLLVSAWCSLAGRSLGRSIVGRAHATPSIVRTAKYQADRTHQSFGGRQAHLALDAVYDPTICFWHSLLCGAGNSIRLCRFICCSPGFTRSSCRSDISECEWCGLFLAPMGISAGGIGRYLVVDSHHAPG